MSTKPLLNLAGLISSKGQALPAPLPSSIVATSQPIIESVKEEELPSVIAPRKIAAKPKSVIPAKPEGGQAYWKAMTLKLDYDRFVELKHLGVVRNKTSQDCLVEALDLWLDANRPAA
jgi:hypothetical protein